MKSKTAANGAKKHVHQKYFFALVFILNQKSGASPKEVRVTEEWRIVSGSTKKEATNKIMNYISVCESTEMMCEQSKVKGYWKFTGLRGAWIIEDELTDGAEIAWFDHGKISKMKLGSLLKFDHGKIGKKKLSSLINSGRADVNLAATRNYILNSIQV